MGEVYPPPRTRRKISWAKRSCTAQQKSSSSITHHSFQEIFVPLHTCNEQVIKLTVQRSCKVREIINAGCLCEVLVILCWGLYLVKEELIRLAKVCL